MQQCAASQPRSPIGHTYPVHQIEAGENPQPKPIVQSPFSPQLPRATHQTSLPLHPGDRGPGLLPCLAEVAVDRLLEVQLGEAVAPRRDGNSMCWGHSLPGRTVPVLPPEARVLGRGGGAWAAAGWSQGLLSADGRLWRSLPPPPSSGLHHTAGGGAGAVVMAAWRRCWYYQITREELTVVSYVVDGYAA